MVLEETKKLYELIRQYEQLNKELSERCERYHYQTRHSTLVLEALEEYLKEPCSENYDQLVDTFETYKEKERDK